MHDFGFGHGFGILFWILLIVVIVLLVAGSGVGRGSQRDRGEEKTPLDILKERYARGEIDDEEFERKRRELQ